MSTEQLIFNISENDSSTRVDKFIKDHIAQISRSYVIKLIKESYVLINDKPVKPGYKIKPKDRLTINMPEVRKVETDEPQQIELDILFEDNDILLINKQPGLVVHPAPGHPDGTLVNAILYHCGAIHNIGERHGIVHRLDQDTSGCLIVAKTNIAHQMLSAAFKSREVLKQYLCLVYGVLKDDSGLIDFPIGRHPANRKKQCVFSRMGRNAETYWKVKERFSGITFVDAEPKTGRTHQIRVHFAAIQHPIIGDSVYGFRKGLEFAASNYPIIKQIKRQMLHAHRVIFKHPITSQQIDITAPIPQDMKLILEHLQAGYKQQNDH